MTANTDTKSPDTAEVEAHHAANPDLDEKAKLADYKADAIDAENVEHNMGVLEAVRAYPMASLWAFIMSCTIVSLARKTPPTPFSFALPKPRESTGGADHDTARSWSPTASSS
jgi:SP family general alpha glucoside:H+ symporter-like MFS transporter